MKTRLSKGFKTFVSNKKMGALELIVKSMIAGLLGVIPYFITTFSLALFRFFAKRTYKILSLPGMLFAVIFVLGTKIFAFTQIIVWGRYVKKPVEDKSNTRLAYYGASSMPWHDLLEIYRAFNSKSLTQWSSVLI